MSRDQPTVETFATLPIGSRIYVSAVVVSGAAALVVSAMDVKFDQAVLFAVVVAGYALFTYVSDRSQA